MEIFISWSGELSKELGEIFSNWIPAVLQYVKPYFTPDDVEKGSRWSNEIAKELEESQIGVMVLTRDNLQSPWIMFEAGALSKQLDKSRICPVLFGLANTDLVGPLVQFQATSFTKRDIQKLVKTINNACSDKKLADGVLESVFEMWWPKLEEQVNSVMGKERDKDKERTELRPERELIEEILSLTRMSASVVHRGSGEEIPEGVARDLGGLYRELELAVEIEDIDEIKRLCDSIGRPIHYITRRIRRAGPIKERQTIDAQTVIDLFKGREEKKEEEGGG